MIVIGMMSGTSHDAIDAGAAEIEMARDELTLRPLGHLSAPYAPDLRVDLAAALPPAATTMAQVCALDTRIGQAFADLAERADTQVCGGRADLVVSHGQTVYHWVDDRDGTSVVRGTLQLGQPAWIAERTGCSVVADLRPRDVAAGGQGAPLVSAFDVLWLAGRPGRSAAVNLGGIANLTVVGGEDETPAPLAYDTGPANALIDAAVGELTEGAAGYDADGRLAAAGQVVPGLLEDLLAEPYYRRSAPKTTGKELFNRDYLRTALSRHPGLAAADVVATLTRLTARTVADAARSVGAQEIVAAGGGTANPTLMAMLRENCGPIPVLTSDELGVPAQTKEAYAFAVLGWLTAHGLPGSVPSCTGARHASLLGSITPGRRGFALPAPLTGGPTRLRIAA